MRHLVLLVLLAGCTAAQHPQVGPPNPVMHAIDKTHFIPDPGCTGVMVALRTMVTAKHCMPDGAVVGQQYDVGGVIKYISPREDFAVVSYPAPRTLGDTDLIEMRQSRVGEHIYVVGFPVQLGSDKQALTVTDGIVAGPINDAGEVRITAPVYFGNSGGGVWGDDGALIGIAVNIYAYSGTGGYPLPYVAQAFMVPAESFMEHL